MNIILNVFLVGGTSMAVAHGGQDTELVSPKHIWKFLRTKLIVHSVYNSKRSPAVGW